MEWLIPILGGVSGVITLFLSRPEQRIWAVVTVCLILTAAGWQSASQYSQQKTIRALNERTHRDLESSVSSFLLALGYLYVAASDGKLPTTEEEFFSEKAADTICNHLNIQGKSMTVPALFWWQFSGNEAERFHYQVSSILTSRATSLDPEIVKVLARQENSLIVNYLTAHRKYGLQNLPNSFCGGVHGDVASALHDLRDLYIAVKYSSLTSSRPFDDPWKYLGRRDLFGVPGRDRI